MALYFDCLTYTTADIPHDKSPLPVSPPLIHHLPLELLSEIFIQSQARKTGYNYRSYYKTQPGARRSFTLRLVCQEWNAIVLSTKELWNRDICIFSSSLDTPQLTQYLDCLADTWPLTISTCVYWASIQFHRLPGLLASISSRIESWNEYSGFVDRGIAQTMRMDILHTFRQGSSYFVASPDDIRTIEAESVPALRRLTWQGRHHRGYPYGFQTPAVICKSRKLNELSLMGTYYYLQPFLQQSQLSPDITHLSLNQARWWAHATENDESPRSLAIRYVQLPNLQTLWLSCNMKETPLGLEMVSRIIEQAPLLTHLIVGQIGQHCLQYRPPLTNSITRITFNLTSYGGTLKTAREAKSNIPRDTIVWLERFPKLKCLILDGEEEDGNGFYPDIDRLLHILSTTGIPTVTEIIMSECAFSLSALATLSWARSMHPCRTLKSTSEFTPCLFSLISCYAHLPPWWTRMRTKYRPILDIRKADWNKLNGLLEGVEDWEKGVVATRPH
jgi:hypothetical protein